MTKHKVLVFDDDPDIRFVCEYWLTKKGWMVSTFPDANRVLEVVKQEQPTIILMDLLLPGTDGREAIRLLQAATGIPSVPIIVFTAAQWETHPVVEHTAGILEKPFDLTALEDVIKSVVEQSIKNS